MLSWSTIQTLLILFGPILYSRGKAFYLSTRARGPVHPLSPASRRLLNILFIAGVIALASTFEYFHSENIFKLTSSRLLQTPTDVLFRRLSKLRELTESDEILRGRLSNRDGRLIYAAYGPEPLIECHWCSIDDPNSFLFYALPKMALPHLLHIAVLGLVTSSAFSVHGNLWRTQATIAGVGLFLIELYMVGISSSGTTSNAVSRSASEVVWTHWNLSLIRGIGMAAVDGILGYFIFLSGTGRWTAGLENHMLEQRLEMSAKGIESIASKLHSENFLRNAILQDRALRKTVEEFWKQEENLRKELTQDEEVKGARLTATSAVDMDKIMEEAGKNSEGFIEMISTWRKQHPSFGTPSMEE
ncbi:hypothetical protein RUND412_003076 [Rhizina undulata]